MQYVGKVFSTVSQLYKELNPATLSGAIDVVVVEDSNGEFSCSPFHVRFGKLQLLRPSDKAVQVIVNDRVADFYMKVGDSGEGFFVLETESDVPSQFATSPVASPALSFRQSEIAEEDPDFLDLGGNVGMQDLKDGYVSAPSAAETDSGELSDSEGSVDSRVMSPRPTMRRQPSTSQKQQSFLEGLDRHGIEFLDDMAIGTASIRNDSSTLDPLRDTTFHQLDDMHHCRTRSVVSDSAYELEKPQSLRNALHRSDVTHDIFLHEESNGSLRRNKTDITTAEAKTEGRLPGNASRTDDDGVLHTDWDWGVQIVPRTAHPAGSSAMPQTTASEPPPTNIDDESLVKSTTEESPQNDTCSADIVAALRKAAEESAGVVQNERALEMSLCGMESLQTAEDEVAKRVVFDSALVSEEHYAKASAAIIADSRLVFRVGRSTYVQHDAFVLPLIAQMAYGRPLNAMHNNDAAKRLHSLPITESAAERFSLHGNKDDAASAAAAAAAAARRERRWWPWSSPRVSAVQSQPTHRQGEAQTLPSSSLLTKTTESLPSDSQMEPRHPTPVRNTSSSVDDAVKIGMEEDNDATPAVVLSAEELPNDEAPGYLSDDARVSHKMRRHVQYAKTLRLTSEQLQSLRLRAGSNDVKFLVPSNNAYCEARIFLYRHDTQIVISDIDGTITKSDALGHLFNMVGKDWTHHGVAKLYTDIVNNGYEILYLTSRAIGQADGTRYFLSNVKQGAYKLPLGPLLLSPDRLFTSFHREVIKRRPHEFKMACLRDINNLFGESSPFYAGFGNRISDAMSYRSVNVPVSRICTIDSYGEIKLDLLPGYKSSYVGMNDLVDMMFPALSSKLDPKYNNWEFWRPPLPSIEDELDAIEAEITLDRSNTRKNAEYNVLNSRDNNTVANNTIASTTAATNSPQLHLPLPLQTAPLDVQSLPPSSSPTHHSYYEARADSNTAASVSSLSLTDSNYSSIPTGISTTPVGVRYRQRADSWTTPPPQPQPQLVNAQGTQTPVSTERNFGRMSILKKASAFSPFNLVRGSSPPNQSSLSSSSPLPLHTDHRPPKFTYDAGLTDNKSVSESSPDSAQLITLSNGSLPSTVPNSHGHITTEPILPSSWPVHTEVQSTTDAVNVAANATIASNAEKHQNLALDKNNSNSIEVDSLASDAEVANAASRLVPNVNGSFTNHSNADLYAQHNSTSRIDSNVSFRSQDYSADEEDEDAGSDSNDEDYIDQETLAIMHDLEELQHL
ncbi:LNS2-domain-containing protein [Coemansia reversa NRRL 1564]|uniref:phosphatidate phosphatase n=1 Tax=Coemansia reversa (strain ATCC 12441 / NRRL 1564) TaxID=763665 RepID=A0A2G5B166_COERN|nr:LNS2-domain-containing protein [Coemansia reversa NRRL 1564]|eukprot:PIA12750.1 LNS2-domain-containing protein [Coemansia reversa NRRL 1564]